MDPNAPKRPNNAYIFFGSFVRPQILEKTPSLSATEIMSEIGAQWKALSEEDKKVKFMFCFMRLAFCGVVGDEVPFPRIQWFDFFFFLMDSFLVLFSF